MFWLMQLPFYSMCYQAPVSAWLASTVLLPLLGIFCAIHVRSLLVLAINQTKRPLCMHENASIALSWASILDLQTCTQVQSAFSSSLELGSGFQCVQVGWHASVLRWCLCAAQVNMLQVHESTLCGVPNHQVVASQHNSNSF